MYTGQVHVYAPTSPDVWDEVAIIPSPFLNANFGISVDIDDDSTIIVGANGLGKLGRRQLEFTLCLFTSLHFAKISLWCIFLLPLFFQTSTRA
jgi:hypothetical protein